MSTIDQQFVEYIVKTLVNNPDKVSIDRTIDEKGVLLSLEVDPEDVGRIIGRRGATAQSIRTLLRALGTKNDDYEGKHADAEASEAPATEEESDDLPEVEEKAPASDLAEKTRAELADLDDLDI